MLIGSDETNYKAVEAAIGRKVDILRTYDRTNSGNYARLTAYSQAGYFLLASKKFCLPNGQPIPATQISASLAPNAPKDSINADYDAWNAVVSALNAVKIPEHEEDAKAAAGSGNADQLNAAIDAFVLRYPDNANCQNGVCWTGFDLLNREPLYRAAGVKVKHHVLDPYELAAALPWAPFIASYGQDLNYLNQIYPGNTIWLGEVNAPNTGGPGAQAAWMNQLRKDLEASYPMVKGACLWQGTSGTLTESAAELALMKSGFFAPQLPPAPPAIDWQSKYNSEVTKNTALQTQVSTLQAGYAKLHDAASAAVTGLQAGMS